jgi:hypothetical protein
MVAVNALVAINCKAQYVSTVPKRFLTLDVSMATVGFQYDNQPIGKRLGVGFRVGVSQFISLNKEYKLYIKTAYSQLGSKRFRVFPTGIKDTVNIYNTLQIFEESVRLHYIDIKAGIRRTVWSNGTLDAFVGVNVFSGLLVNAHLKGEELQGGGGYNVDSRSVYYKLNYGFEPELGSVVHLSNGSYFILTASYEVGIPNVYNPKGPPLTGAWATEHTRAFSFTVSLPFLSH